MKITTVGIDLAKNVFQVHGIDERGKAVLRKQLRRAQVAVFFGNLPPCVIGMEHRAAGDFIGASGAPGVCEGPYRAGQSDPWVARRIWTCHSPRDLQRG
jgi:hypothetical protein